MPKWHIPPDPLDQIVLRFLRTAGPFQIGHLQTELRLLEKQSVTLPELRALLERFCASGQAVRAIDQAGIVRWDYVQPAPEPEPAQELQKSLF